MKTTRADVNPWRIAAALIVVSFFWLQAGCAAGRNTDTRSNTEVFLDVVAGFFEKSEVDEWRDSNRQILEQRRQWQCDNLAPSELKELGIHK